MIDPSYLSFSYYLHENINNAFMSTPLLAVSTLIFVYCVASDLFCSGLSYSKVLPILYLLHFTVDHILF